MTMKCTPLQWPRRTLWSRLGLSLFSPFFDEVHAAISRQLSERSGHCMLMWTEYPEVDTELRKSCSAIIKECMFWPNDRFIPDDPVEILFYDPTIDLRNVEAIQRIEELGVGSLKLDFDGQFINFLKKLRQRDTG